MDVKVQNQILKRVQNEFLVMPRLMRHPASAFLDSYWSLPRTVTGRNDKHGKETFDILHWIAVCTGMTTFEP